MPSTIHRVYALLKGCDNAATCRQVHFLMTHLGFHHHSVLGDLLIRLFSSHGTLLEANVAFSSIDQPSVYTWHAIISAHCSHGQFGVALDLYYKMVDCGIQVNRVILLCATQACGGLANHLVAKSFHNHITSSMQHVDVKLGNAIVDMYAKCGCLEEASKVFDNVRQKTEVSWTVMISAYVQQGLGKAALEHFEKMKQAGVRPNEFTYATILKACAILKDMESCKDVHDQITCSGFETTLVVGCTLVDMYAKLESLQDARHVFDKLPNRNVVTWNAMIAGYCQHGEMDNASELIEAMGQDGIQYNASSWNALISGYTSCSRGLLAVDLYQKMQIMGVEPDIATFLCLIKACTSVGALAHGRRIHKGASERGLLRDTSVGNSLVDMYCKCSSLPEAVEVLEALPKRSVVSWGAMIDGYTQHGFYERALHCFHEMQEDGVNPVYDTYTSILGTCQYLDRVEEGYYYFRSMSEKHGIAQGIEHFCCMVDLLGHAGRLHEAAEMLRTNPNLPSLSGWMSLLTACKKFGNRELGHVCFEEVVRLDPNAGSGYVLMSNAFADTEDWAEVDKIQARKAAVGAVKKPGRSWVEVVSGVHEFAVGDRSHVDLDNINMEIKRLRKIVKEEGHVPQLNLVLQPLSDERKEDILWGHSERLALAFGLISTPPGATIRITKNLRVCVDCHSVMKIVSKVERRQIIIRDAHRVHQFTNGECSCMDQCV